MRIIYNFNRVRVGVELGSLFSKVYREARTISSVCILCTCIARHGALFYASTFFPCSFFLALLVSAPDMSKHYSMKHQKGACPIQDTSIRHRIIDNFVLVRVCLSLCAAPMFHLRMNKRQPFVVFTVCLPLLLLLLPSCPFFFLCVLAHMLWIGHHTYYM